MNASSGTAAGANCCISKGYPSLTPPVRLPISVMHRGELFVCHVEDAKDGLPSLAKRAGSLSQSSAEMWQKALEAGPPKLNTEGQGRKNSLRRNEIEGVAHMVQNGISGSNS